jgi:uncharacterized RDD family membrane protein YckC
MRLKRRQRSPTFQPLTLDRQMALKDLPLASFRARLGAYAIDIFLVCGICGVIEVLLRLPEIRHPHANVHIEINPFHSWSLAVLALYYGLSTYWGHGQTLGKLHPNRQTVHDRIAETIVVAEPKFPTGETPASPHP